jgi:hypothetical protein
MLLGVQQVSHKNQVALCSAILPEVQVQAHNRTVGSLHVALVWS